MSSRIAVDLDAGVCRVDGLEINLSPKETELLYLLTRTLGKPYKREEIVTRVWGFNSDLTNEAASVTQLIHTLRAKLRRTPLKIESRWGFGYKAIFSG